VETLAGRRREFTQAGFELVGAAEPAADAEVIALSSAAVSGAGISDFRLVVGHLQYFDGILQDLKLSPAQAQHLQRAINRNSEADLDEFLRTTPLRTQQRHTVEQLPLLSGPDALRIIDHADRLCLNYTMHRALANLRAIYQVLTAYAVTDQVYLDLTEINNLGYYTGISFEILVPGIGFPIGSGGRYDNLIGTFGPSQPAVGVALGIDRIVEARRLLETHAPDAQIAPHVLVAPMHNPACYAHIAAWRSAGLRVALSLNETAGAELWQQAQRIGTQVALTWTDAGYRLYHADPASGATQVETLAANEAARVVDLARAHYPPTGA
jgi:ATP phosphoribosyltransferase regulatory subunit